MIRGLDDPALGAEAAHDADRWVHDRTHRDLSGVTHRVEQEAALTVNGVLEACLGDPAGMGSADPLTVP